MAVEPMLAGRKVTLESPHRALAPSKLVLCLVGCRQGLKDSPARCTAVLSRGVRSNCTVNFRALDIALYLQFTVITWHYPLCHQPDLHKHFRIYISPCPSISPELPQCSPDCQRSGAVVRVFIVTGRQIIIWGYDVKIRR